VRSFVVERTTTETSIRAELRLDDEAGGTLQTGLAIFDHFLHQFSFHGGFYLDVVARSLDAIRHHLVEDAGIAIGRCIDSALGERRGIARYATVTLPMDDALVRVALDLGGRPHARINLALADGDSVEGLEVALVRHFFSSLSTTARIGAHVDLLAGSDPHHCVEAAFKAFGRACRAAWALENPGLVPSTKGVL
jgi:imidazoleglycerol-phosphate dehydratase